MKKKVKMIASTRDEQKKRHGIPYSKWVRIYSYRKLLPTANGYDVTGGRLHRRLKSR